MKWLDLPPVWTLAFVTIASVQARFFSLGLSLAHPVTSLLAGLLVGAGVVLILLAAMEFKRHKTTIVPHQAPAQLIQTGVFKRSRNPIYLGDVILFTGLVLWLDAVLSLVLVPALFWVLETRFIIPEEDKLRRTFRADFARYAQKTRRWL
ncbi:MULTISPECIES: isoprenylcysteine carboxylmethyltransferase family protein [Roseobacter]|uniref:methyltransferase family protein n=1 Tax=Roseobacter TaxID=2433 RepID=UPI001BB82557|nr:MULTISPECIES: isoprenylcysteine carboxylmethyltransferase family protein [Roseobacter]GIT87052.1 S-isoprenylcysteine methyltransferase [Roseobacter sp. OBYS 0001]